MKVLSLLKMFFMALLITSFGAIAQEVQHATDSKIFGFDSATESALNIQAEALETKLQQSPTWKPRVSLITSVYDGDFFVKGFLEDVTSLQHFEDYELILINANSPGHEEPIIREYMARFPNIVYERLEKDPGIYGVWNLGVKKARADYVSNSNLDDRRNPDFLESQIKVLDENPGIDLVYADYFITFAPNETFKRNTYRYVATATDFSPEKMYLCLPGPHPVWRKAMHEKYGFFRADFCAAGDFEMWNRAVIAGSKFKKVPGISGLFYENPEGLSNTPNPKKIAMRNTEHTFIRGAYKPLWNGVPQHPLILIKIPTRERPEKFFTQLDRYYGKLSGEVNYHFVVTCDADDATMNNPQVIERLKSYPNLTYGYYSNASKTEAYNRDLDAVDFDVLLATADDMEPATWGFDKTILETMRANFPDFDGVLNYNDGHVGAACNTYPIVGKKFFARLGYLYHPSYRALFANEELTLVSRLLGKEKVIDDVIIRHNHPVWGGSEWDNLYYRNEGLKEVDRTVFNERRAHGFYVKESLYTKDWSILICTIDERAEVFQALYDKIMAQIKALGLENKIELLFYKDKRGEHTVGSKRNELIRRSQGKYISFVDDDDMIHENYVGMIYEKLKTNPDCVKLVGVMTTNGENPQRFVHSIEYNNKYTFENGVYVRPPNHINPIRRSIAAQFAFPETNVGEDQAWTLAIARTGLLKKEASVDEPYYFYRYDGKYHQTAPIKSSAAVENKTLQYYCVGADAKYYDALIRLIASIHAANFDELGEIAVANLGLTDEQIQNLKKIDKVTVFEVDRVHPDILKQFVTSPWGKMIPGWYAWKPVAIKQTLQKFPYVLWMDATAIILKPLGNLFNYIKQRGYFLGTIGNEIIDGKFRFPMSWCTTKRLFDYFKLGEPENQWILSAEQIMSTMVGVSREASSLFLDQWAEMAKDLSFFADDGTAPNGFGTGRHDQSVLALLAYTQKGLEIQQQDYTQQRPMLLKIDGHEVPFYVTWHGGYVNDKTDIYHARGESKRYEYLTSSIKYKK